MANGMVTDYLATQWGIDLFFLKVTGYSITKSRCSNLFDNLKKRLLVTWINFDPSMDK